MKVLKFIYRVGAITCIASFAAIGVDHIVIGSQFDGIATFFVTIILTEAFYTIKLHK